MQNYYHILGISIHATPDEINQAMRRFVQTAQRTDENLAILNACKTHLLDPLNRKQYDRDLLAAHPELLDEIKQQVAKQRAAAKERRKQVEINAMTIDPKNPKNLYELAHGALPKWLKNGYLFVVFVLYLIAKNHVGSTRYLTWAFLLLVFGVFVYLVRNALIEQEDEFTELFEEQTHSTIIFSSMAYMAKQTAMVIGTIVVIGFAFNMLANGGSSSSSNPNALKSGSSTTSGTRANQILAQYACEDEVKKQLKAPASAQFSNWQYRYNDSTKTHTLSGSVDSQNSYGAMLRSNFVCTAEYKGDGQFSTRVIF
ncbi:hypothetical protein MIS45_11070 [Wielerella bovis]|uniref:J domain-containing protein n=1 Tax=Wielerella bovis TaxID=2917790 RepID=UPI002019B207|nr:hypothetical protein [Wielerella bovis]ULJ69262.1 hypothetical protein MIS45_11070 [Wielerella bovis]